MREFYRLLHSPGAEAPAPYQTDDIWKFVAKYLHWGKDWCTFEPFRTIFERHQLQCLFAISNGKLPV